MKLILHGELGALVGREHEIQTDCVADAIEGLSRQLPNWPRDMVIDVIDYDTEFLLTAQTDATEVHLVPRMYGGGGKWGSILIGAALIGLSFLIPPAGIGLLGMTITNSMVFMMGAGLMLTGISQLFMKAPTVDKSSDPPPSKYLGVNKNTSAIGTLIPFGYGRHLVAGQWLSIQVNSNFLVTTRFPATTS